MSEAAAAAPERASLGDWLAIAGGMIGATMALMDVSIVNSSLPTIQGEIGATPSEATWVSTSYLVSEIVVIPLTAWLERLFGQRRMLLGAALLFTLFSVMCGLSTSLAMLVAGRVGQGLSGGVLIPSAMALVATRLPPAQQAMGLSIVAMSALLGPVIGPVLGGWLTENYSWHYAFFINVPVCAVQAGMILIGLRASPGDIGELRAADWLGVAGMIIGLGAATTLLEEGHREQWFESPLIWRLAFAALFGFALVAAGQFGRRRPVIRLALMRNAALSSAVLLLAGLGMLLYTGLFIIPQFLAAIAGYNAFQAGTVMFYMGIVSIPAAMIYPLLAARLDARMIIAGAMLLTGLANWLLTGLTAQSGASDFIGALFLYGIGTTLAAIPLQQAVISAVPPEDATEANSLSSVSRNLGGSLGLAAVASFQEQRLDVHRWQLHGSIAANDAEVQRQMAEGAALFGGGPEGMTAALQAFDGQVMLQALTMTFNDLYLALAVVAVVTAPFVLLLRRPPADLGMGAMH